MKRIYVIISDGHGEDTIGKWSPVFRTTTKLGDIEFLPGERFIENYFNDRVADLLENILRSRGIPCEQLAPEHEDISLRQRAMRQESAYNVAIKRGFTPITMSIHANGLGIGDKWNRAQGIETFYKNRPLSSEEEQVADDSLRLASLIQNNVMDFRKHYKPYNHLTNRGVKTANFFIFRNYKGIVVLPESEFMTNIDTLKLLCSNEFQRQTAEAYFKAIKEFQGFVHIGDLDPKENKKI